MRKERLVEVRPIKRSFRLSKSEGIKTGISGQ